MRTSIKISENHILEQSRLTGHANVPDEEDEDDAVQDETGKKNKKK